VHGLSVFRTRRRGTALVLTGPSPMGTTTETYTMALKLTHAIRNLLLSNHIRISRTTDKAKVLDFLSSVKPLQTNHDLIRLGGATDGGYLVPNDIEGTDVCFSPA